MSKRQGGLTLELVETMYTMGRLLSRDVFFSFWKFRLTIAAGSLSQTAVEHVKNA